MADLSAYVAAYQQCLAAGDNATAGQYLQYLQSMGYGQQPAVSQLAVPGLGQQVDVLTSITASMAPMQMAGMATAGLGMGLDMSGGNMAAKVLESGTQVGTIKNFDESKGFGFIDCPEARQATGLDVFLMRSNLNGQIVQAGDRVSFTLVSTSKGPRADNVQKLAPGQEPLRSTALAPAQAATMPDTSMGMMAGAMGSMGGLAGLGMGGLGMQSIGLAGMGLGGFGGLGMLGLGGLGGVAAAGAVAATGSYVGTIKSFDDSRGFGFIDCEVTRRATNKDVLLLRSQLNGTSVKMGDKVSFNVEDNNGKGYKAVTVQVLGVDPLELRPAGFRATNEGAGRTFYGEIKQYDDSKGYGFIGCAESMALYNKDIFLLRSTMKDAPGGLGNVGDKVSFTVNVGTKGPVAENVVINPSGASAEAGSGGFGLAPAPDERQSSDLRAAPY